MQPADAEEALQRAWAAEKGASDLLAASTPSLLGSLSLWGTSAPSQTEEEALTAAQTQLENEVVQADAYLMASLMQLLLGSYVKGAWNVVSMPTCGDRPIR